MRRPLDFDVAIEHEFRAEQAAALKVAAQKLQESLQALAAAGPDDERDALVRASGERAWYFVIQRESMGLLQTERALDFYKVPGEVRRHIGPRRLPGDSARVDEQRERPHRKIDR